MRSMLHATLRGTAWHARRASPGWCQRWQPASLHHHVSPLDSQRRAWSSTTSAPAQQSGLAADSSSRWLQEDPTPGARLYNLRIHKLPEYQMDSVEEAQLAAATSIITSLQRAGHQAYVAGGWVRDKFLGRPAHDVDIATSASTLTVERLFPMSQWLGRHTVRVCPNAGGTFEVTSFRGHCKAGRAEPHAAAAAAAEIAAAGKPLWQQVVAFRRVDPMNSAYLDAALRDFSINSLLYDPVTRDVLDFVGGVDDIHHRVLRINTTPREYDVNYWAHHTLHEDPIRVLRAVRFRVSLPDGFELDSETTRCLRLYARQCSVTQGVSPSRLYRELDKMADTPGGFAEGMALAHSLGLLHHMFPFLKGQGEEATQRGLAIARQLGPAVSLPLRMAALLEPKLKPHALFPGKDGEIASVIQAAPIVLRRHVVALERMIGLLIDRNDMRDDWAPVYAMDGSQECLQVMSLWSPHFLAAYSAAPPRTEFLKHHEQRQHQWREAIAAAVAKAAAVAARDAARELGRRRLSPPLTLGWQADADAMQERAQQWRALEK